MESTVDLFLTAIVAPAALWFLYHRYKDRFRPEPLLAIVTTYLLGIAAGFVALRAYSIAGWLGLPDNPFALAEVDKPAFFAYALLFAAPLEEGFKFLPFWLVCMRFKAFDEEIDGIVYASVVGLGFASYENIIYMQFAEGLELYGRAIATPLTHAVFASIWGYACGRARHRGVPLLKPALVGLALSFAAHGVFNFLTLATHPVVRPLTAVLFLGIWIWRIRLIERLHERSGSNS